MRMWPSPTNKIERWYLIPSSSTRQIGIDSIVDTRIAGLIWHFCTETSNLLRWVLWRWSYNYYGANWRTNLIYVWLSYLQLIEPSTVADLSVSLLLPACLLWNLLLLQLWFPPCIVCDNPQTDPPPTTLHDTTHDHDLFGVRLCFKSLQISNQGCFIPTATETTLKLQTY